MSKKILTLCMAAILSITLGITALAAPSGAEDTSGNATVVEKTDKKSKPTRDKKDSTRVSVVKVAASVLGISEDDVKTSVKTGKVGDLLVAANKVNEFKAAYLAEVKAKLDATVTEGTMMQAQADEKYAAAEEKMASYDGTTHLCGGSDHSKMSEKKDKPKKASESADAA